MSFLVRIIKRHLQSRTEEHCQTQLEMSRELVLLFKLFSWIVNWFFCFLFRQNLHKSYVTLVEEGHRVDHLS